jgi:ArsR family transcriptional regulator, arsenate/arsenite/antimonite-responsive transcriptional repressor
MTTTLALRVVPGAATGDLDEASALAALAALSQAARLRVFRALVGAGPTGLTPGTLAATLGLGSSTLSFHLRELMNAGLVSQQRHGRHLVYRPDIERMNALLAYLTSHCCDGADCGLDAMGRASTGGCAPC